MLESALIPDRSRDGRRWRDATIGAQGGPGCWQGRPRRFLQQVKAPAATLMR
jgi:hypothetical protein